MGADKRLPRLDFGAGGDENRVEHDVWYIDNWSFTLDLKIITTTVLNTFRGEINAY